MTGVYMQYQTHLEDFMLKTVVLDGAGFSALFKKKVIAPLKAKLGKIAWPMIEGFLHDLEEELPLIIYGWITFEESKKNVSGAVKYSGVVLRLTKWATAKGYGMFLPILLPLVEVAVRHIYRGKVESIFDKFGVEDMFEKWLGISVGSDPPAAAAVAAPAAETSAAK